jgi:MerR family transcriptional regulator/heat shock protein HspR
MGKEFWTVTEVLEVFEVKEEFLLELEEEEVVCPTYQEKPSNKLFSQQDMENLRLAKILVEDMGVNLAGVEVVLRMRQSMMDMRRQFDDILEDLAGHIQKTLNNGEF